MILQALAGYYRRMSEKEGSKLAPEGFEMKGIPFVIVLDRLGNFVGLEDTREGRDARVFLVPKGQKKASGIATNLLWDTPAYVMGYPKLDLKKDPIKLEIRAREQFQCFHSRIRDTFPGPDRDEGVQAVLQFLEAKSFDQIFAHPAWAEIEKDAPNLTFRLNTDTCLVCQRSAVVNQLTSSSKAIQTDGTRQVCLISGGPDVPMRLHTAIKGVWGGKPSGANIVSFNLDAFRSFGKKQGLNAPVGKKAEFAYTTALNALLVKGSRQRLQVGDATTVFWAEKQNNLEDSFAEIFGGHVDDNLDQAVMKIRILFEAPKAGVPPLDKDYTRFYVLGLAPNAARIAVRFWYAGTVGEVAANIIMHFDDLCIVHAPYQGSNCSLNELLAATATQTKDIKKTNRVYFRGKFYDVEPGLAGNFMKATLTGTPYPQTLLAAAIRRCRAEQSKRDPKTGKLLENVPYPRASLIKAVLARTARLSQYPEKEVGMALDTDNSNIGYRLGRLFATLEKIQGEASPGLNATIRDRFYGSASGAPVTAFPHLMNKLLPHHLAKLDNRGRAVNLEKLVSEIMSGVTDFPSHLSLQDQGRFAVGYYHQRQDFFTK